MDDARVLAAGAGALALGRESQRLADPLADGPARLARGEGIERQVLDVLLAAAERLEADRGDRARVAVGGRG